MAMLELRPQCEHCNKALPPASTEAMICSFECTFCRSCVDEVLQNVCPNCGGGFCARPIRPVQNHRDNNYLGVYPPGERIIHRPVVGERCELIDRLRSIPPEER